MIKPMWIQAILDAKAVVAARGHGGYPDPDPKDVSITLPKGVSIGRVPVKAMPWWDAPIAESYGDLDIGLKKCLHKNTQVVLLLFSSVTECKDCGEVV